MREKKRGILHRTFLTAFTFVLAAVFAGFIGKADVKAEGADAICKVTINVTDSVSGETIDDAQVVFATRRSGNYPNYTPGGDGEVVAETSKNADGSYNVPYHDDGWGDKYYYYAKADGYRLPTSYPSSITINGATLDLGTYSLTPFPPKDRLEDKIGKAQDAINNYVNNNDYDSTERDKIIEIKNKYLGANGEKGLISKKVSTEGVTAENVNDRIAILDELVAKAKEEMDAVATSQENMNEEYANCVSFVSVGGDTKSLARISNNGKYKYTISLSLFEKGGMFQVDHDVNTPVTWNAKMNLWYQSASGSEFEIIDNSIVKGKFLNQAASAADRGSIPFDAQLRTGMIENASVTFTKDGKAITVTFDLNIIARNIYGITVKAPEEVVLEKNEAGDAYKAVEYTAEVSSDDPGYKKDITIENLTPEVANVNQDKAIIPLKAGTAKFKATADGLEPVTFSIIFSSIDEVNGLIEGIEGLGEITLDNADAVAAARAAYDALSDVAKDKVTGLKTLENAEKKILELRTAAAEAAKAEAEKEKQEALDKAAAAEAAKAEADKAKQEALDKAAAADKAKQEALDKAAAAEAAKAEAERQAAAEKAAAEQAKAEKEAAEKAAAEAQAKAEAAEKAAAEAQARAEEAERAAAEKVAAAEKAAEEAKAAAQEAQKMAEEAVKSTLPKLTLKVKAGKKKATISWKKANNVTGYVIYRSTKKNGGYEQIKVIKNAKTTKFTDKNLKSKKTYYYKICAYKGNVNGNLSAAKKVKVK